MQLKYATLLTTLAVFAGLFYWTSSSDQTPPFSLTLESKNYSYKTDQVFLHYFHEDQDQAMERVRHLFPDLAKATKPSAVKLLHLTLNASLSDQDFWQRLRAVNALDNVMMTPYFPDGSGGFFSYSDEIMVILKEGETADALEDVLEELNMGFEKSPVDDERFVLVKFSKKDLEHIEYYLNTLKKHPSVLKIQPNYLRTLYQNSAPSINEQWHLEYDENFQYLTSNDCLFTGPIIVKSLEGSHINAMDAWNIDAASNPNNAKVTGAGNGTPIKIAVLDDGVELSHEALANNLVTGFDAVFSVFNPSNQFDGLNTEGGNGSPNNAHGTGCAGIIAANTDVAGELRGVAYEANIIPIRIMTPYTDGSNSVAVNCININGNIVNPNVSVGYLSSDLVIYKAFQESNDRGADIFSNSWSYGYITPSSVTITYAIVSNYSNGRSGKGASIVFSSGNDNNNGVIYPSIVSSAISVGSSTLDGHRKSTISETEAINTECVVCPQNSQFNPSTNPEPPIPHDRELSWGSNYGDGLDLVAPGVRITTTDTENDYTSSFSGTSSACPVAAGVLALILDANPNLTSHQARYILESTCTKVHENDSYFYVSESNQPNGSWNNQVGYGRVDAHAAVKEANDATCVQLSFDTPTGSFGDGSVSSKDPTFDYNYNINQTCSWQIQPPDAVSITLSFSQFDLAYGDLLEVYEGLNETGTPTIYSAFNAPTTETFDSPALFIKFVTDENPNGGLGWSLDYTSEESTAGDNCNDPIAIQCGQVLSSSTLNGGDNIDSYNCVSYNESGPEQIFEIELDATSVLDIVLTIDGFQDLDLFLLNSCDPSDCIDYSGTSGGENMSTTLDAGTYYIVVDGYNGSVGDFTLSVNCDDGSPGMLLCNEAININCGSSVSGSTANGFNHATDYDCQAGLSGSEAIYRFQLSESKPINIEFTLSQNNMRMLLLDACDPDDCIAQSTEDISFNQLSAGEYFLIIDAPPGGNGDFEFIISCGLGAPDLTYGDVHTINQQGTNLSGSASVYNASCNGTAGASITHFYLSIDTRYDNGNDILVHSMPTPALAPDETFTFDYDFNISNVTPGWYYLFYRVDATNVVSEAFGNTNNYVWRALDERVAIQDGSMPNVTLVHGLSELVVTGDELTHSMKIVNTEPVAASAFKIGYYLSDNLSISTFDNLLGEVNINGLSGNETMDLDFSADVSELFPNLDPGFYTFGFIIDSDNDLQQSNEDDDTWRWTGAEQQIAISESSYCDQLTILTEASGTFGDGSGSANYVNDTYCQWLISPSETASSITLTFESFDTEFNYDVVEIYSGSSLLNTQLAELDGNIGTTTVTANSSQMYIRFSSDYSSTDPGWTASYTSVPRRYCDGLTELYAESGQINDGSFCLPYQDNMNCSWLIDPGLPNTQLLIDFEEFALVSGQDFLYVYDGDSDTAPLLATLSGETLPDDLIVPGGQAFLKFVTDGADVLEGFTINYQTVSGSFQIAGAVHREDGYPIAMTTVACSNQDDQVVDATGTFDFQVSGGVDYLVRPSRNFNWKEGVNIADYIYIQNHATNVFPLSSPYQIIAADVNRSGSVTTIDAYLVYQLILNNITEFPNNESWRFIDAAHQFSNPSNPWADNFPEQIEYNNINQDWTGQDFIAVKVGDVNGEADGNLMSSDIKTQSSLTLQGIDHAVKAGETFEVQLRLEEAINLMALQTRLQLNTQLAELVEVSSPLLPDFDEHNININPQTGAVNIVWVPKDLNSDCISLRQKDILFTVRLKAKVDMTQCKHIVRLAPSTDFSSFILDAAGQRRDVNINWLLQNVDLKLAANPNPFLAETQVRYTLPKTGMATLRILNMNGQTLQLIELPADQKTGTLLIEQSAFPVAGTYLLELIFEEQSKTIQIIHL